MDQVVHEELKIHLSGSIPNLGLTHPPTPWIPGALSPALKQPQHQIDPSCTSSAKVKNVWSFTSTCLYYLYGTVLRLRSKFILFTLYICAYLMPSFHGAYAVGEALSLQSKSILKDMRCGYEVPGMILLQASYLFAYSLLRGVTF
jgi:hypothetical protein